LRLLIRGVSHPHPRGVGRAKGAASGGGAMHTRIPARLAWVLWTGTAVLLLGRGLLLVPVNAALPGVQPFALRVVEEVCYMLMQLAFATLGVFIMTHRPTHRLGWLFCAIGLTGAIDGFAGYYALDALLVAPGTLPGGLAAGWLQHWDWYVGLSLLLFFLPLLFPTGRLLSPRWRVVGWLAVGVLALQCPLVALQPGPLGNYFIGQPPVANPVFIAALGGPLPALLGTVLSTVGPLLLPLSALSLLLRLCRSRGEERAQIKWVVYVGAITVVLWCVQGLVVYREHIAPPALEALVQLGVSGSILALPLAAGLAIFKYRLYTIDFLINRTLVYSALTASVVTLYVLVVGALGALFQAQGNGLIVLLATGLVAMLFQPLRARLQRGVNRLLYGERDEPYVVLSRLGRRLEATLAPGAILPTIVETVREALKLPYAALSVKQDEAFILASSVGTAREDLVSLPLVYQHTLIGQLLLAPRAPGEPLTPTDLHLLNELARQAAVAVQAARLTTDLERLTVDLQHSRQRLVTAREEERRRLRRDLHDGLGPTLGALLLQVGSARVLLAHNPVAADGLLSALESTLEGVMADIRRLVYNLRPPALDDLGLAAAIRDHAARYTPQETAAGQAGTSAGLRINVEAPERLPELAAAVEVAAYRIVQEALTNVVRHAEARTCLIRLSLGEALCLEIEDDGVGVPPTRQAGVGLRSMRERAEELGGTCLVEARPSGGTRVRARLPLPPGEGAPLEVPGVLEKEVIQ
jgi:two-component system, NarL family, sensor kinase